MKCTCCNGEIDGKYAIYSSPNKDLHNICRSCLRKIKKGIIKVDMSYVKSDSFEPVIKKYQYRGLDIIGIPIDVNQSLYIDIMIDFLKDMEDRLTVSFIGNKRNNRGAIYAEVVSKTNSSTFMLFLNRQYQKGEEDIKIFYITSDTKRYIINYKDGISNIIKEESI